VTQATDDRDPAVCNEIQAIECEEIKIFEDINTQEIVSENKTTRS